MSGRKAKKKVIGFTGGGSGGHIFPIVSLLEYAHDQADIQENYSFVWFGERDSLEQKQAKTMKNTVFVPIFSGKLRRYWTVRSTINNLIDQVKVVVGFFQSLYLLKKHRIEKLFCKGGYVALPVSLAAKVVGIPVLMHESDMHAGLTNRIVSKVAATIFTGFDGVFADEVVVGQILSKNLLEPKPVILPGLDLAKPIILTMGGSQGAGHLCKVIKNILVAFPEYQFITITGTKNSHWMQELTIPGHSWTVGFISQQEISYLYKIADSVVTRGSASSLAEQALYGLQKIIVPLPYTGGNHQEKNADWYVANKGDTKLLQDTTLQQQLEEKLHTITTKRVDITIHVDAFFKAHSIIWDYLTV